MPSDIIKYTIEKNNKIIESSQEKLFLKPKKRYDMDLVYQYLEDHNVGSYLKPVEIREDVLCFPYLKKTTLTEDEKAKKLILNLSLLQNRTTTYVSVDPDKVKEFYEDTKKEISYLSSYYHDLQDMIEGKVYMLPSEYFFLRNVSMVYDAIHYSGELLEKWYEKMLEVKTTREVYCHGKCELSHFLDNDNGYFISLENAHIGRVDEDITNLFKKHYKDIDMISTYRLYQHKYPYQEEEELLFYLNLVLPKEISCYPCSLKKMEELVLFFEQMKYIKIFLLEQQEKEQKNQKK